MARRSTEPWDGTERRAATTVAVVGDDPDATEVLARILAADGYRVVTDDTVDAARDRAADELPRAVIVDLEDTRAEHDLLRWFRAHVDVRVHRCRIFVIAGPPSKRAAALGAGADVFLARPFHASDLLESLATALSVDRTEVAGRLAALVDD